MAIPTIDGVNLEGCTTIIENKNANIIPLPIPTLDADETEVFDFLGVTRIITVVGDVEISTAGTLIRNKLDALCDGDQTVVVSFTSDSVNANVMVASFTITTILPGTTFHYEFKLFQGVAV